jgi:hypothetical protein
LYNFFTFHRVLLLVFHQPPLFYYIYSEQGAPETPAAAFSLTDVSTQLDLKRQDASAAASA